jgi:FlaA1/EpsC-like NDP-sugar epimerase
VDDDPKKKGKVIHGLRVFGGNGSLGSICKEHKIDEIVISTSLIPDERIAQIRVDCQAQQVAIKRMTIHIESLN